jgi:hypothetical protein
MPAISFNSGQTSKRANYANYVKHNPSTLKYFKNKNNPLHKNIDK